MSEVQLKRILIVGGTGVFGQRLTNHLSDFSGIELLLTSRSADKAKQYAAKARAKNPDFVVRGIALDHTHNLSEVLGRENPFIVVDCSGPFQDASYNIAEAALNCGAHFIDLADANDYLRGFANHLDELAKAKNLTALTGASSTPTLSTCVVRECTSGWQRVDSIDLCIAPAGKSEVGNSVIESILSFAGKNIATWKEGELQETFGWSGSRTIDIPHLAKRRIAHVETYDAELFGPMFDVQSSVSFAAGLESRLEQWGVETLASLRRRGLWQNLRPIIPALLYSRKLTRIFNSDRGGMIVQVRGLNAAGKYAQSSWSLLAKQDHGPCIPILPAAAAVRKILANAIEAGAEIASNQLELDDILHEMKRYDISTETHVQTSGEGIFETSFGKEKFASLPDGLKAFHGETGAPVWSGSAQVTQGNGFGAKFIAKLFGFPAEGENLPVTVSVRRTMATNGRKAENWTRNFAGREFSSTLRLGTNHVLSEQFGPFEFSLDAHLQNDELALPVSSWKFCGIPLPLILAPKSQSREYQDKQGRFCFDIRLSLPVIGLLTHYRGWLLPAQMQRPEAERAKAYTDE